jgi:hypothetical protein
LAESKRTKEIAIDYSIIVLFFEAIPGIHHVPGGGPHLRISRCIFPFIERVFADSGYAGECRGTDTAAV